MFWKEEKHKQNDQSGIVHPFGKSTKKLNDIGFHATNTSRMTRIRKIHPFGKPTKNREWYGFPCTKNIFRLSESKHRLSESIHRGAENPPDICLAKIYYFRKYMYNSLKIPWQKFLGVLCQNSQSLSQQKITRFSLDGKCFGK